MTTRDIGLRAEKIAIDYLEKNGYILLEKNYRYKNYEIDIIVKKGSLLIFVEVKYRSGTAFGMPEETVKNEQKNRIIHTADVYIHQVDWNGDIRFDIISLVAVGKHTHITHFEDAFY